MTNRNDFIQRTQRAAENINGKILFKGKPNRNFFKHPVFVIKSVFRAKF